MAIRPEDEYPSRSTPADADYPHGSAKNESSSGANDGTPYTAEWRNDIWGFFQWLLATAGITPNGTPDTVQNSQYGAALLALQPKSVWWGAAEQEDQDTVANLRGEMAALSPSSIVAFTGTVQTHNLVTLDYSGGAWSQNGAAGPNIVSGVGVSVAAIGAVAGKPRVAVFNCALVTLETYEFTDGVGWAKVGNTLNVGIGAADYDFAAIAALTGTRVVLVAQDRSAVFDFGGTDWTQAGSTFTLPVVTSVPAVCSLGVDLFCVANRLDRGLQAYTFDGSVITERGSTTTISGGVGTVTFEICPLNDTDVMVLDNDPASGADAELRVYRLAGEGWALAGNTATLSGGSYNQNELVSLTGDEIVFIDEFNDAITRFRLPYTFGKLNTAAGGAF